jgi:hypothetical protein
MALDVSANPFGNHPPLLPCALFLSWVAGSISLGILLPLWGHFTESSALRSGPSLGSWGMVGPVSSQNGGQSKGSKVRAPRVELEALTIARGTSALGPTCSNKVLTQATVPTTFHPLNIGADRLSFNCAAGNPYPAARRAASTAPFSRAYVGQDPLPAANYLLFCALLHEFLPGNGRQFFLALVQICSPAIAG